MKDRLDITVRDSVFEPEATTRQVEVRLRKGQKPRYRVHIFLEGDDLPYVRQVTYVLHPTFKRNKITIKRLASSPLCKLSIWTWGLFVVQAIVMDKSGGTFTIEHSMSYSNELEGLPAESYKYA